MLFEVRRMAAGVAAPVLRKEYPVRVLSPPRTCATNVGWPEPLRQSTCSAGSANILHEAAHVPNRSTATSVTSGLVAHTAAIADVDGWLVVWAARPKSGCRQHRPVRPRRRRGSRPLVEGARSGRPTSFGQTPQSASPTSRPLG